MAASIDTLTGRLTTIKEEIEGMIGGLSVLKWEIQSAEQERDRVQGEARQAAADLAAKRQALHEVAHVFPSDGEERVSLDYQATLAQIEDTSPSGFGEVAGFLRERHLDPSARSSFSPSAVDLARYLGIPVNQILGSEDRAARFSCDGVVNVPGLAFSMALPHSSCGIVTALEFDFGMAATCEVFAKAGTYEESLSNPSAWSQAWSGELRKGWNSIPVDLHLKDGLTHSFYMACSCQKLTCSTTEPDSTGVEPLTLTPGRVVMQRFQWPHRGAEAQLNLKQYYFVGNVKYMHYAAPSKHSDN